MVHLVVPFSPATMTTLTATDARKTFFDIVKKTNDSHEIYHVHHKSGDVVILSENEYSSLIETIELLSIPGFKEGFTKSVKEAKNHETLSFEEVFGEKQ